MSGRALETEHGYGRYTNGCRCLVCKAAKAEYMRAARARARERRLAVTDGAYVAPIRTHGYNGYQNAQCRCPVCVEAKRRALS